MIINYSTLLEWQQVQDQFEKGKEVTVFHVNSREEAEKLKAALDSKQQKVIIVKDIGVSEDAALGQQAKENRKKSFRNEESKIKQLSVRKERK